MSSYYGDLRLGDTIDIGFTTRQISGAPFTLAGSPVISAYPGNSTTQLTAGITLSVDFDSVTGLNNVRVVATTGNGYATATNYKLVITTGTVNSVSVVGEVIGSFSIENRVINRAKFDPDTGLQSLRSNTAQAGAASTITLDTGASSVDDFYNGGSILTTGGTGAGQFRIIVDYVGSTRVATVDAAWATNPDSTTTFAIFPASESAADIADAIWDEALAGHATAGTAGKALSDAGGGASAATIADAVWDEVLSGHTTAGTGGKVLADAATQASVNTIDDFLDTEMAAVLAAVDTEVAAIKAKTDSLTFTVANQLDANVQAVNDVTLQGVGTAGNKWRPV